MQKAGLVVAALLPVGLVGWALVHRAPPTADTAAEVPPAEVVMPVEPPPELSDEACDDDRAYVFRLPSGEPTMLSCDEAGAIVDQVRAGLAYAPEPVSAGPFAVSTADWLDPHGMLTLAKDAPSSRALRAVAPTLLADIEGRRERACASADGPGAVLETWVSKLRRSFDEGRRSPGDLATATLEPLPPTASAREMAEELGRRAGAFEAAFGDEGTAYADEARRRFFPPLDKEGWARVVLASAVRAYVPLVDPHGEWAPFDEESRIYEIDLASRPPPRLWGRAVLTAVGVRVMDAAAPPLAVDDVVLSVAGIATAGLPLEQVDQLGFAVNDVADPVSAVVLRDGELLTLDVARREDGGDAPSDEGVDLPFERVAFGDGDVLIVSVSDVRDDLGDDLAVVLASERDRGPRRLTGVVLDLRGNGGGSTDGAIGALAVFLPGAPLFAMKRRDGTVEIDRAPVLRDRDVWTGPVASFVDGTTASAAEMIAGALAAYRRGPIVGSTTFGKGCAQEYVDDDAHAGVLRLTTLVYALPDGTPVQRLGLAPQLRFPFMPRSDSPAPQEREAKLAHAAPPWRGPDVRDLSATLVREGIAWPSHGGSVGPCRELDVCKALRVLGHPKRTPTAKN